MMKRLTGTTEMMTKKSDCSCHFCKRHRVPWLWKLENCFWFEIPKNSSTGIKQNNPDRKMVNEIGNDDVAYFIYRNPIDRFESLMSHFFEKGNHRRYEKWGIPLFKRFGYNIDHLTPNQKVELILDNLHRIPSAYEPHHFWPQSRFLDFNCNLKKINIEDIDGSILDPKSRCYESKIRIKIDDETYKDRILELYREDVELGDL